MWMLVGAAFGADPAAGMIWPGAGDVARGDAEAGFVAGGISGLVGEAYGGVGVRGAVSPAGGVVLSLGAMACGSRYGADPCVGGAARGLVVDRPGLRFGFAGGAAGIANPDLPQLGVGLGAVLEAGERVRLDVAWPLYVDDVLDTVPFEAVNNLLFLPVLFAEVGVTLPVGERDAFRFGKDVVSLTAAWRHEWDRVAFEARAGSAIVGPLFTASTQVLWRFGR